MKIQIKRARQRSVHRHWLEIRPGSPPIYLRMYIRFFLNSTLHEQGEQVETLVEEQDIATLLEGKVAQLK